MARIKKLVMHGFKSFANRTEIPFGNTYNVILGPNGAGKSNVLDAICFVLGRMSAKSMRVEKASNLIFNGGKARPPMTEARVTIVFDNEDGVFPINDKEVRITRIIKQNGQGIYMINERKTTRTSILELLGAAKINPEGYNIVLQGDVVKLIEMNSIQKRQIIEEISGISQYEEKKKKAENELEKVKEKINEANIILAERKNYLRELKKERDQALKYKELKENIDKYNATYLSIQLRQKEKELEEISKESSKISAKINSLNNEIEGYKTKIQENKKKAEKISREIEERGEKTQVDLNRQLETLRIEKEKAKLEVEAKKRNAEEINSRIENIKKELKELEEEIEFLKKNSISLEEQKKDKENSLEKLKEEVEKIKSESIEDIERIEARMEEIEKETDNLSLRVQQLREKQQELIRRKDKAEYDLQNLDEQIKKTKELKERYKKEMEELASKKNEFKKATLRLNTLLNQDSEISRRIGDLKKKIIGVKEKVEVYKIKNESAKRVRAGDLAIQRLLEQHSIKGIFGTVADLGSAPAKYSKALDSAAGQMLKYVIVESDKTAAECIKFLKEKRLGVVSFIPLNKIKDVKIKPELKALKNIDGVIDFAINLINTAPTYKKAFRYVFGDTLVVRDVDVARRIGIGRIRMVTLDGDIMEASGVMRGGFKRKESSFGFKREEFAKEIEKLENELTVLNHKLHELEGQKEKLENEIGELRKKKAALEGEIIKMEKSLYVRDEDIDGGEDRKKELEAELITLEEELRKVNNEISKTNRKLAELKIERQKLKEEIAKTKDPVKIAEIATYEENIRKLEKELFLLDSELKLNKNQSASKEKEISELKRTLKELERDKKQLLKDIDLINEEIKNKDDMIKEKEKRVEQFYVEFKELFEKRNKLEREIELLENEIDKKSEEQRKYEQKQNILSLKKIQLEGERTALERQLEKYKGVEIFKEIDENKIKREISHYEMMINEIGAVNLKALEVYEKLEKEYKQFLEKKKTLEKEREDVINLIRNLEEKKKNNFLKTYNVINENFSRIFSELFPKEGEAYLELENMENPFEGGVNIKVKLGTNKFIDLRGFSGGEKTMTALAFIFALQEYEPAPFYVLDEVDSTLDKRNCEKLAQRIKKYSKKAQYIVISHNDAMISEADFLFGVSMNNSISKIISLKL